MAVFLLEVGTEELPASFVGEAIAQWQARLPACLGEQFLQPSRIAVYGTPRRLAVLLEGLPDQQDDRAEAIKGPPAAAAFNNGQPTKAAEGSRESKAWRWAIWKCAQRRRAILSLR